MDRVYWKKYGEHGKSRTAREFIEDLNMELVDPTEEEINELIEYLSTMNFGGGVVEGYF